MNNNNQDKKENNGEKKHKLPIIPVIFKDRDEYRNIFRQVIYAEAEANRKKEGSTMWPNVKITWDNNNNNATLLLRNRVRIGQFITIQRNYNNNFNVIAVVTSAKCSSLAVYIITAEVIIVNNKEDDYNNNISGEYEYTVKPIFNPVVYTRMYNALDKIAENNNNNYITDYLSSILLGKITSVSNFDGLRNILNNNNINNNINNTIPVPGLPSLNTSQEAAVLSAIRSPISLIQGPPGTGKTVTTASIIYNIIKLYNSQILVCGPSNISVDNLARIIHKTGIKVIRMVARSRERIINNDINHISLHVLAGEAAMGSANKELRDLYLLKKSKIKLSTQQASRLGVLYTIIVKALLSNAQAICVTCSTAADKRLDGITFRRVIIDEAAQATEPDTLVCIARGAGQLCLVGDHCQLGPVVIHGGAAAAGLDRSLFERLLAVGHCASKLTVQYRMHPFLAVYPSLTYYGGILESGVSAADRQSHNIFQWVDPERPLVFYNIIGSEEIDKHGKSISNSAEAAVAERFLAHLINNGASPSNIGILTPYDAQVYCILHHLSGNKAISSDALNNIEVATVDSFQGREKDFIIFSCVRSNKHSAIGFLKDRRRMNVAITRARRGIIIIGDAIVLARDTLWRSLILHCLEYSLAVYGEVHRLQISDVTLPSLEENNDNSQGVSEK